MIGILQRLSLDNILFANSSTDEHVVRLTQLFERINKFGIIVSPERCVHGGYRIECLGYMVNA